MATETPIIKAYLAANPYQSPQKTTQKTTEKKKQSGRGGTLTSLISEGGALGGGATGAAIGSGILPGVGTLIGGALGAGIGAFTGRLAENKVRDNRYGLADAAKEGAITGLLSAPGKGLKVGLSATKALAKGGGLEEALMAANKAASKTGIVGGVANKIRKSAEDRSAKGYGNKVGATQAGQVVKPGQVDDLQAFINGRANNYGGVKPGAPANQARDAENVLNEVTNKLGSQLSVINRPLAQDERNSITTGLAKRVQSDAGLTGDNAVAANFHKKITNAKSVAELEDIRKEAQDLAFKQNGAKGDAAVARQAEHARDTIDEFVTNMKSKDPAMQAHIDEYKAVKGDYRNAKQLADNTAKEAGKTSKGLGLPFINGGVTANGVGGNVIAGARNKINAKLAGVGGGQFNPAAMGARMGVQGSLADAVLGTQGSMSADTTANTPDTTSMPMSSDTIGGGYQNTGDLSSSDQQQDVSPYSRENLVADIQRDPKHASDYIDTYNSLQEIYTPKDSAKGLNSTAAGVVADTQTGLQSLSDLYDAIGGSNVNDPVVGKLRSLNPFDTSAQTLQQQIAATKQIVGKALEGGVLRKEDEAKYAKILPTLNDTDTVAKAKIQQIYSLISQRLNSYQSSLGGAGGGTDLTTALMQSGGYQ